MKQICHLAVVMAALAAAGRAADGQQGAASPAAAQQRLAEPPPVVGRPPSIWPPHPFQQSLVSSANMSAPHGSQPACNCPPSRRRASLFKSFLQRTHWGYCNYFEERPFGDALLTTMDQQIARGSEDTMMLYYYDFHPRGSRLAANLTYRGNVQLLKMVDRMQYTGAPIQVQITPGDEALNESRRQRVVSALAQLGLAGADQLVVLQWQKHGARADEAVETMENLLESVRSRGRTLRAGESPMFGGGFSGGFGN